MIGQEKMLVIYGCGEMARRLRRYFDRDGRSRVKAFVSDYEHDDVVDGLPVCSFEQCQRLFPAENYEMFVSIGYSKMNTGRERVCERCRGAGYRLASYISPKASCWDDVVLGDNVFIEDNVFVGDNCKIGNGVFIKAGSVLCHDDELHDYVFFSGGVVLGGHVTVGNNSFVGLNATIKSHVEIGRFNVVGAGANVIRSTVSNCVSVGNPARSIEKDVMNVDI